MLLILHRHQLPAIYIYVFLKWFASNCPITIFIRIPPGLCPFRSVLFLFHFFSACLLAFFFSPLITEYAYRGRQMHPKLNTHSPLPARHIPAPKSASQKGRTAISTPNGKGRATPRIVISPLPLNIDDSVYRGFTSGNPGKSLCS